MIEKLKTLIWFSKRISYWRHALSLIARKFYKNNDSLYLRVQATEWAANQYVSLDEALSSIGILTLKNKEIDHKLSKSLIEHAILLAQKSKVQMGGAGDLDLLYSASKLSGAKNILETGVAYGWSSQAILRSLSKRSGRLISVDMPMLKQDDYELIGLAVEDSNLQ